MDWLNLLAAQGTLKSLLQHEFKASKTQHSAFFIVQLSHPYMTTGKNVHSQISEFGQNMVQDIRISQKVSGRKNCPQEGYIVVI